MADKDQVRKDEENIKNTPQETEVTELDDQSLDEASGGSGDFNSEDAAAGLANSNTNCVC